MRIMPLLAKTKTRSNTQPEFEREAKTHSQNANPKRTPKHVKPKKNPERPQHATPKRRKCEKLFANTHPKRTAQNAAKT